MPRTRTTIVCGYGYGFRAAYGVYEAVRGPDPVPSRIAAGAGMSLIGIRRQGRVATVVRERADSGNLAFAASGRIGAGVRSVNGTIRDVHGASA